MKTIMCAVLLILTGCATNLGSNGPQKIGPDTYMIGGLGHFFDYSVSAVKIRMYREASIFCENQGRDMIPLNSTGHDSGFGEYASAEVQFRCQVK